MFNYLKPFYKKLKNIRNSIDGGGRQPDFAPLLALDSSMIMIVMSRDKFYLSIIGSNKH